MEDILPALPETEIAGYNMGGQGNILPYIREYEVCI